MTTNIKKTKNIIPENKVKTIRQFLFYLGLIAILSGVTATTIADTYFGVSARYTGYITTLLTSSIMVAMLLKYKLLELDSSIDLLQIKNKEGEPSDNNSEKLSVANLITLQDKITSISNLDSKSATEHELLDLFTVNGVTKEDSEKITEEIKIYNYSLLELLKKSSYKESVNLIIG